MKTTVRPATEELRKRISEIQNLNLANVSIEDIKAKLKLLFTGYAVPTLSFLDLLLYRGIKYKIKPELFHFLSSPPSTTASMGRANRAGVPVFYCATDKNVPFYELGAKPGEKLVISEWTIQKDLLVNIVGYTDTVFTDLKSSRLVPNFIMEGVTTKEVLEEDNILIRDFLAKSFSQKISENELELYKLTNAIAEKHFSENHDPEAAEFKGLMYPTIRMGANADNLAITQLAIAKGYLQFAKVEFIEVLSVSENIYTYKILDVAFKICDEKIQWKKIENNWITDSANELYIIENDNGVFAHDSTGELRNPLRSTSKL